MSSARTARASGCRPARPGSRRRAPATCSPASSARSPRPDLRRSPRTTTASPASPRPEPGCTAARGSGPRTAARSRRSTSPRRCPRRSPPSSSPQRSTRPEGRQAARGGPPSGPVLQADIGPAVACWGAAPGTRMTDHAVAAGRMRRIVTGPIGAWTAFLLVHVVLALINLFDNVHLPFGDVVLVYRFWMDYAAQNGVLVGIDTGWVYPVGALLPMGLAYVFGSSAYGLVWLVLVTALDAVAFAVLLRRSRAAAWWWVAFLAALGPVAVGRLDSITAPLAILGLLWLSSRPVLAGALLALGAWIKVWPAALLAAGIVAVRRRSALILGAAAVSAVVLAAALVLGGGANLLGFLALQGSRGLQLEAPVSAWWLWEAVLGLDASRIYYDREILTYQVLGAGVTPASAAMTPLLVAAVAAVLLLALRAMRREVAPEVLLVPLTLAIVGALLLFNKVGSPQFVAWLAAPILLGLVQRQRSILVPAALVLGIAALTQIVYPWIYGYLVSADSLAAAVLTLRNAGYAAVFVVAVRQLWLLRGTSHP